ncbi:MBOAT family O-acyltransferase (plasmid) [Roseobacteraceae bacterium NS-SX3]
MLFASPIFLFGFLPAFLLAYYLTPLRWRSALILVASYVFYGWWRADYLALVLGISLVSYASGLAAARARTARKRKEAVTAGVSAILAALVYFKYSYFLAGAASSLSEALNGPVFSAVAIVLPIGISFLSFQSISYIIDVAREDAPPAKSMVDFLAFSSLFPQLIAGPVLRYKDLADQFEHREHSWEIFARGVRRFISGLAMKLLIADTVAPLADRMFTLAAPTLAEAWLGALAYSVQLLFDFAGYSAMAIGLGLMIGFRFAENFDAPYTSRSVTEFWRRWHISLSTWLRDYVYVPLGGNRHGTARTYRNLMLTMVLGGFWHGANWTFLLWGAWHGAALALERVLGARGGRRVWPAGLGWPVTMLVVILGWVMFRAPSVGDALLVYAGMAGLNGVPLSPSSAYALQSLELAALVVGGVFSVAGSRLPAVSGARWLQRSAAPALLMVLCVAALGARSHSPFLYFQF